MPGHHGLPARHAQTALEERVPGRAHGLVRRIDQDAERLRDPAPGQPHLLRDRRRVLDHRDAQGHPDLGCGEADARGRVHGGAQGGDEAGQDARGQLAVEGLGGAAQDRITRGDDRQRPLVGEELLYPVAQGAGLGAITFGRHRARMPTPIARREAALAETRPRRDEKYRRWYVTHITQSAGNSEATRPDY